MATGSKDMFKSDDSINKGILRELTTIRETMVKQLREIDLEFTSSKSRIDVFLDTPLNIDENGGFVGFKKLFMYYSIPNISAKNNNFKYAVNGFWNDIYLDPGSYEIKTISSSIENKIKSLLSYRHENAAYKEDSDSVKVKVFVPKIPIESHLATGKSTIEVPEKCQVDFSAPNSIGSVLGFNKRILEAGIHVSDNLVNIMSINSISVSCELAQGSIVNGKRSNRLFTFFPNEAPGEKINITAKNIVYYPLNSTSKIVNFCVELIDQNGVLIDNRGDEITIVLSLKY